LRIKNRITRNGLFRMNLESSFRSTG
jgi:hypothetical protein